MKLPFDYQEFFDAPSSFTGLKNQLRPQMDKVSRVLNPDGNVNVQRWMQALESLPSIEPSSIDLDSPTLQIGSSTDTNAEILEQLEVGLRKLDPWRKGPFNLFDVFVDAEWRSDWKWDRIKDHISPLDNRLVLDIGSNNGYHCWRMAGAGAKLALGVDPYLIYVMQFQAISKYLKDPRVCVLPIGIEDLPEKMKAFDTVFSMGVLYHRKSPIDHLFELRELLKDGGELVLETLVVEGEEGFSFVPPGRYAKMRNVWFLPSCLTLEAWLKRCGFKNVRLVNETVTSIEEQRVTPWMTFESLKDYMSEDLSKTIEGHPPPKRAVFIAEV